MPQRKNDQEVPPSPVLRRRGPRPGAGADTPAGMNTDRSVEPEKRQQAEHDDGREEDTPERAAARAARAKSGD